MGYFLRCLFAIRKSYYNLSGEFTLWEGFFQNLFPVFFSCHNLCFIVIEKPQQLCHKIEKEFGSLSIFCWGKLLLASVLQVIEETITI